MGPTMHIVAAKFDTIRNMPQLITELKRAAFPTRAGIKSVLNPSKKTIGAAVEKSAECQLACASAFAMNG